MSKRRIFQIHLSTAVVLMLVAGALVWANVRQEKEEITGRVRVDGEKWYLLKMQYTESEYLRSVQSGNLRHLGPESYWIGRRQYQSGWPLSARFEHDDVVVSPNGKTRGGLAKSFVSYEIVFMIPNILVTLAILVSVCVACEGLIRRRKARKASE